MKRLKFTTLIVTFVVGILSLVSCKKDINEFFNEQFPEVNNTTDNIFIDGEIAAPLINTKLTLRNFIPDLDSSLWAEIDENDLVHLRMYFRNVATITAGDLYGTPVPNPVPPDSTQVNTDTNKLKVYEHALSGHLFFNDPKFTFIVKNEIPVVTFVRFDTIRLHDYTGQVLDFRDETKHYIGAPSNPGEVDTTTILVDKNAIPDFEQFFSPVPKFTSFSITTGNDQTQTIPASYNYTLSGNEKISLDVDIDLPLDAHLVDLVMADTSDFSLPDTNIDQIKSVTIKLILDNDFPVGGIAQLSFADTNDNGGIDDIIMNVFDGDGWEFKQSITDPNGVTTSSVRSMIVKTITQEQLDTLKMYHASKIIFTSNLNSYQSHTGQDVKIYGRYQLGVKLGVKIDYAGNTGDIPSNH